MATLTPALRVTVRAVWARTHMRHSRALTTRAAPSSALHKALAELRQLYVGSRTLVAHARTMRALTRSAHTTPWTRAQRRFVVQTRSDLTVRRAFLAPVCACLFIAHVRLC